MKGLVTVILLVTLSTTSSKADLFYPLSALEKQKEKREELIKPTLSGIILGKETFAIINGKIVKPGDRVGKCIVESIEPKNQVVRLKCGVKSIDIRIDLLGRDGNENQD